ncbi:MAG: sensor histidine kinase [Bacteroidia bacterium]
MKIRFGTITIHALAWALLFIVPFFSTYQVITSFAPAIKGIFIIPIVTMSLSLIGIFYFNYFILIPKFLLPKKYWQYILTFICSIAIAVVIPGLIFYAFGLDPTRLDDANPILAKIKPIAQANAFLMLLISIVASISLTLNNRLKQTEKEKLSAQLSSLQSQINPHFLFNTLNSIYATTLDSSPQAADMIDKLSEMMRYTTKKSQTDFVPLEEEINYINNYIDLQSLRISAKVKLNYQVEGAYETLQIAPMLLIPFIENAFKHGINSEEKSEIDISIEINRNALDLHVANKKVYVQRDTSEHSGLGIENTKRRLELIYPSKHILNIHETADLYTVSLHILLQ